MGLTKDLNEFKQGFLSKAPQEAQNEMMKAQKNLLEKKVGERAIKVGDLFPKFELQNVKNETKKFDDLFGDKNFLIVSFYRGGWCPYCNIELKALQDNIQNFHNAGANLIAISPESPDNSMTTAEKNEVKFEILTDKNSELAKKINMAFELPENLKPLYQSFGIDVAKHNDGDFNLPLPATFILNKTGEVLYRFIDLDYTVRLDPQDILNFLKKH